MIRLQKYTPEVYYNQSRDFQFIGRLYDLVINSIKTNADLLHSLPLTSTTDQSLLDLIAFTLGFKLHHNYSVIQLKAISSIFTELLRNKGNIQAIQLAGETLLHSEGVQAKFNCEIHNQIVYIYVPQQLKDITLFKDLLTYILPAGMSCKIIRAVAYETTIQTTFKSHDEVQYTISRETTDNLDLKSVVTRIDNISMDFNAAGTFINSVSPQIKPIKQTEATKIKAQPSTDKDIQKKVKIKTQKEEATANEK